MRGGPVIAPWQHRARVVLERTQIASSGTAARAPMSGDELTKVRLQALEAEHDT
jgi:hypothetical protein